VEVGKAIAPSLVSDAIALTILGNQKAIAFLNSFDKLKKAKAGTKILFST
jgi:hypothetical protein